MWKCQNCGTVNNSEFCETCNCAKPIEQKNRQNAMYTNESINTVTNISPTSTSSEKSGNSKKIIILLSIVFVILIIAATAVITFKLTKDSNKYTHSENHNDLDTTITNNTTDNNSSESNINASNPVTGELIADDSSEDKEILENNNTYNHESEGNIDSKDDDVLYETDDHISYKQYTNNEYGLYCPYPENFTPASARNAINSLVCLESPDKTAVMTVRAAKDKNGITIDQAVNDFKYEYDGEVTYYAHGDTWYAISCQEHNRIYYRKFFTKNGNMYCFDFEYNEEDKDLYYDCIEYIEDNFKAY